MQLRYIQAVQKVECFFKIFIGFSGETHNHIHSYTTMRHQRFDVGYTVCIQFPLVTAAHQAQNLIAAALQGNMEMRYKLFTLRYKLNDFIGEQVGFNGGYAVTFNTLYFIEFLNETIKIFFPLENG